MGKHLHKKTKRHNKKHKRHTKKMYGGDFSDMDKNELLDLGFNNEEILLLESYIPNLNLIRISLQQINHETGNPFTPEELMQSLHDTVNDNNINADNIDNDNDNDNLNLSGISNNSDDSHELNNFDTSFIGNEDSMNTTSDNSNILNESNLDNNYSFPSDDDSLQLSDLNDNNNSSYNTTREEEESFGGKKRKSLKKNVGKKKYKGIKRNKSIKKHKRIQKGGTCYGRGVGANNYDPNFSIYNTRELQLFPYRPEK
jgi:hypothetical protein